VGSPNRDSHFPHCFIDVAGFKIFDTKLGQKDGGAQLTPKGREFIGKVDSLLKDLQAIVEERFNQKFEELLTK